jgi:hypothetical protein
LITTGNSPESPPTPLKPLHLLIAGPGFKAPRMPTDALKLVVGDYPDGVYITLRAEALLVESLSAFFTVVF